MTTTIRAYTHRGRHRAAPRWRTVAKTFTAASSTAVLLVTGYLWMLPGVTIR